jgi:alpha-beta hydrolase superfamily lysophospholipase
VLLLAACAPRLQQIGPPVDAPRLTDTAFHTADGVDLRLLSWLPWNGPEKTHPKAIVLALHGFNDHAGGFALPGHGLARRGFAVFAYDQRGFGTSPQRGVWPGSAAMIDDARTAARLLRARYPGVPLYVLGESMGGAVAMAAMNTPDLLPVDGLILESPAIWGWQTQSPFNRSAVELSAHAVPWMTVVPTGLRLKASSNRRALIELARDPLVIKETRIDAAYGLVDLMTLAYAAIPHLGNPRFLMLFGGQEQILNKGAVADALKQLPKLPTEQARLAVYPKGYHLLLRDWEAPQIYDDLAAWMADPKAKLPSGADVPPPAGPQP